MPFNSLAPDYAEARWWFRWLDTFTPTDLAEDMGIHPELAERFIAAGLWHGIIMDSGDRINGRGPPESIYHYVPLPAGPREHPTYPPEWRTTPGCYELAPVRGYAVRIRTDRDSRKLLSTPGSRHKMKLREQAYHRQEQARMEAVERQRKKAAKPPKWLLNKMKRKK
jgi:hypothetical protein